MATDRESRSGPTKHLQIPMNDSAADESNRPLSGWGTINAKPFCVTRCLGAWEYYLGNGHQTDGLGSKGVGSFPFLGMKRDNSMD